MEWKSYEEWLDITLYRQMTNLIYKLSSNEEALYLLKLAENMYQDECMELPEITELIERAEVA